MVIHMDGKDEKQQEQEEKREARRKRRIRNRILAYSTVILFILVAAVGIVMAVKQITGAARQQEEEKQKESQAMIDNLLSNEDELQTPTPKPEPTQEPVVELTPEQKLDEIVNAGIEVMPLEDKVAGLFIVTPEAITGVSTAVRAGEGTRDALSKYAVGGLIYFASNMQSADQLKEMLSNTRLYTKYPLFIAVDEEGGSVSRLASKGLAEKVDSAGKIGQTGDANNAYQAGVTIGSTLNDFGFNLDFAPVADISSVENSYMGDRTYGADAQTAAPFVVSMMQGLKDQKVTACLKHFPGNGATTQDPHTGIATSDRTAEEFRAEEFAVFQAGIDAGADMIMISHMEAPALTVGSVEPYMPCSLSKAVVTDILRNELGFEGVIITDALNMGAISNYYSSEEAAIYALQAGCDMLLMPENFEEAYNGVLQAVKDGKISEERIDDSLRRIYRIKYADRLEE